MSFAGMLVNRVDILHHGATKDSLAGPVAGYNVEFLYIPARVQDHATKLLGNEIMDFGQSMIESERDVFVEGLYPTLGANGNGYAVRFDDDVLGRISDLKRNRAIGNMPDHTKIICKIIGS